MDEDVDKLSRDALITEVKRLRAGIRTQPRQLWPRPVLAPPAALEPAPRADRSRGCRSAVAEVPARMRRVSIGFGSRTRRRTGGRCRIRRARETVSLSPVQ
jgi:hypothetical protein